jgi:tripartite-type tricarboxylate transporter receptor subunit TctC
MRSMGRRAVALGLVSLAAGAGAQSFPVRPVRFIVPFAPGGGADLVARALAVKLTETWDKQVIIDNRPGASAGIAAEISARAPADGHTIFQINIANAIAASTQKKLGYDPVRDFAAVTLLASTPFILVSHPSVRAQNLAELIALAKAEPGRLNYSSSGAGGPSHFLGEMLKSMAKIDLVHVPYQSVAPAMNDLLPGRVQFMFVIPAVGLPHIAAGRLRPFGVSSATRSALAPQLPTIAESGLPGFEGGAWYGCVVPAGTPGAVVTKIAADIVRIVRQPDMRERLAEQGVEVVGNQPDEFARFIRSEIEKFRRVAAAGGISVQ